MNGYEQCKFRFVMSLFGVVVLLSGCGGGGGGDERAACDPVDVAGDPDIMGAPTFTPVTITSGDTVTLNVPVDADTAYVSVNLYSMDRSNYAGGVEHTIFSPGAQTLSLDIATLLSAPAGDYFPLINVCTDYYSCVSAPASTGVAVAYATDSLTSPGPEYMRLKYFDGTSVAETGQTCLPVPYVVIEEPFPR